MDWISLLKFQQADFLQRVKKPRTYDLSLLESQVKGCHTEMMAFWGEPLARLPRIFSPTSRSSCQKSTAYAT